MLIEPCFEWHDQYKGLPESCLFACGIFAGRVEAWRGDFIAWVHDNTGSGTSPGRSDTFEGAQKLLLDDVKVKFRQ